MVDLTSQIAPLVEYQDLIEVVSLCNQALHGDSEDDDLQKFILEASLRSSCYKRSMLLRLLLILKQSEGADFNEAMKSRKSLSVIKETVKSELLKRALPLDEFQSNLCREISPAHGFDDSLSVAIASVYKSSVHRTPSAEEICHWKNEFKNGVKFYDFYNGMPTCPEALRFRDDCSLALFPEKSDNDYIMTLYEYILGRGCMAKEMYDLEKQLASNKISRSDLLSIFFKNSVNFYETQLATIVSDGSSCNIMGTNNFVTSKQWQEKAKNVDGSKKNVKKAVAYKNNFAVKSKKDILVTAIASMYNGADYVEKFMDNITSQTIFNDCCQLVIVDACSPGGEYGVIERYLKDNSRIKYIRTNYRIGIYDAWNLAIKESDGIYITNANLDDFRHENSFELQAGILENLNFVDIVYQDFYYTFDPSASYEAVAAMDFKSNLPSVTSHNLLEFNSPHNAPMWRKSLHDQLGFFDIFYKSAGDYDFWLRCLSAGKCFYKLNTPHVVYYQNPKGLSTQPGSRGLVESIECHKRYARKLVTKNMLLTFQDFVRHNLMPYTTTLDKQMDRYKQTHDALRNLSRKFKSNVGSSALGVGCSNPV